MVYGKDIDHLDCSNNQLTDFKEVYTDSLKDVVKSLYKYNLAQKNYMNK